MILPGNSRTVIVEALSGLSDSPQIAASKVVNDLSSAGYGIVHRDEMIEILTDLVTIIKGYDKDGDTLTDIRVSKGIALCDLRGA